MRKSKFVGRQFGNWTCTACLLRKNYSHGTRHNAYWYLMSRITSDNQCEKCMFVSGQNMTKIAKGLLTPEEISIRFKKTHDPKILYKFLTKK